MCCVSAHWSLQVVFHCYYVVCACPLMGVTAGLEAAHATGMVRHPYHEPCGSCHPGGDDGCWMMHLDQVPKSMGHMLAGLHRKRAAKNLPDLTAQYPPHN